jgi:hypothetical protein
MKIVRIHIVRKIVLFAVSRRDMERKLLALLALLPSLRVSMWVLSFDDFDFVLVSRASAASQFGVAFILLEYGVFLGVSRSRSLSLPVGVGLGVSFTEAKNWRGKSPVIYITVGRCDFERVDES